MLVKLAGLVGVGWLVSRMMSKDAEAGEGGSGSTGSGYNSPPPSGSDSSGSGSSGGFSTSSAATVYEVKPFKPLHTKEGGPFGSSAYVTRTIKVPASHQNIIRALAIAAGISTSELRVYGYSRGTKVSLQIARFPGSSSQYKYTNLSPSPVPGFDSARVLFPRSWSHDQILSAIAKSGLTAALQNAGLA